jgi:hypothetical protein
MSPIPDDFEQLRRLLALKRHEQPPPGYFHGFSRQVIVRIKAGELGDPVEVAGWSFSGGSLLQRIWATLDARPVLAGAFGVTVCGFFVVGALLSDATANPNPPTSPRLQITGQAPPVWEEAKFDTEAPSLIGVGGLPNYQPPAIAPTTSPSDSLFEQIRRAQSPRMSPQSGLSPQTGMPTAVSVSFSNP